jgi:hypothetical protein
MSWTGRLKAPRVGHRMAGGPFGSLFGAALPHRRYAFFAWKLSTNSLATWENKKRRKLETIDTCAICGVEREDTFHTFFRCPMARSLWQAMAEAWPLPDITELENTDSEWLLRLLDGKTETVRVMILMTLWRIWHCRNEVIHQKPAPPIESSKHFLCSYLESILSIKQAPKAAPTKGKTVVSWDNMDVQQKRSATVTVAAPCPWRKPPEH